MADRRDYSGRRSDPTYKEGSYYHRKNAYKKALVSCPTKSQFALFYCCAYWEDG